MKLLSHVMPHGPMILMGTFESYIPPLRVGLVISHKVRFKIELWEGEVIKY